MVLDKQRTEVKFGSRRPPCPSPPQADDPPAVQGTAGHAGGQGMRNGAAGIRDLK